MIKFQDFANFTKYVFELLCILYAKEALDIDAIRLRVARARGNFVENVKQAFGNQQVAPHHIRYATSEIGFSATSRGRKGVPLIVETKHII